MDGLRGEYRWGLGFGRTALYRTFKIPGFGLLSFVHCTERAWTRFFSAVLIFDRAGESGCGGARPGLGC